MSAPTVAFDGFTRRYGDVVAADDVSFSAGSGRVTGLVGRNGAGKSTCLRGLLGLVAATSGSARVFGAAYPDVPDGPRRVGVTMDGLGAQPRLRGEQHLRIAAARLGVEHARLERLGATVGLDRTALRRRIKNYSTGMRQRLALATALLTDPELLVLDEPTNGLDPDGVRWVRRLLRGFAAEGRTVLIASHHLAELEQAVDDVVVLDRTVRFAGPLGELTRGTASLEDRYVELVHPDRMEEMPA
ncbi:ATP-binding cassette domain-containing protein [Patulibacter sp. NPDC049589]|uniref:ABC transporter ATP-binding protein n=1 Tax=Patulibacter sp. NPDC049589 TaxID=3154731 RepID=UPI00343044FC